MQAEEQVRQAKARLNQIRREKRAKTRKEQDHQKFILGGIVVKYFPEAYGFSEQEMCRILACAFKNRDIQNMIAAVVKDRKTEGPETAHNGGTVISDTYREESFYFLGIDDSVITKQEKQQVLELQYLFLNKFFFRATADRWIVKMHR